MRTGKGTVLIFMLDTDICIYIIKRKPVSVLKRLESLQPGRLAMSVITFAELMNGAKKSDKQAAVCYGDVRSSLEKRGKMIGGNDLLIAAHALSLGWTLVTNNEREFGRVEGLKVENWTKEGKKK